MGLTAHQQEKMQELVDLIKAGHKRITLTAKAGRGKLQPFDELILTPHGWEPMINIVPGSIVIGKQGEPIKVLNTFRGENLKIYKVSFCDGSAVECCEDHLWQIQTQDLRNKGKYKVLSLKEIISSKLKTSQKQGFRYSVDLPQPIHFEYQETLINPYVLGVLLGNGHLCSKGSIALSMSKEKVQEMYETLIPLCPEGAIRLDQKYCDANGVGRIMFSSTIKKYLNKLGLLDKLSKDKFIPSCYIYNTIGIRKSLLAGLMDTDGCIQDFGTKKKVSYSTISEQLANDIQELGRSLGGYCTKFVRNRIHHDKGIEYQINIRTPFNPFKLSDRKEMFDKYSWTFYFKKKIIGVDYVGLKNGQCLLVDSSDNLYVTRDYTITHNTYMVNELIYILKTTLYKYGAVYITAPTHKALTVLQSKIDKKSYIHFLTIHSAHQLTRKIDTKTGITTFIQKPENPRRPRFAMAQVVIVDESTMLEAKMLEYNDQHPHLLFIFVGDPPDRDDGHPGQLPPVNEKASPIFTQGYPNVSLIEPVRQKLGSPILELAGNLKLIHSKIDNINENGEGYIFDNNRDYIIDKLAAVNGSDEIKYVAWRNIDVDQMNFDVRKKIYGTPGRIMAGEGLVFAAPYRDYKNNEEFKVGEVEIIEEYILKVPTEKTKFAKVLNSEDIMIQEVFEIIDGVRTKVESYLKVPIKVYRISPYRKPISKEDEDEQDSITFEELSLFEEEEDEADKGDIYVLHEDSDMIFKSHSAELKYRCKLGEIIWPAHYWFEEQFASFKYNHAISAHKSQGSTYQTVIINVGDIELNRRKNPSETNSMLYTAITRAAKLVVLYNVR